MNNVFITLFFIWIPCFLLCFYISTVKQDLHSYSREPFTTGSAIGHFSQNQQKLGPMQGNIFSYENHVSRSVFHTNTMPCFSLCFSYEYCVSCSVFIWIPCLSLSFFIYEYHLSRSVFQLILIGTIILALFFLCLLCFSLRFSYE